MTPVPAISLTGAVCLRAGQPVLRGASLTVGVGETMLVTGANGSGKSTLLRVIAGLLPLAAGSGSVHGHDLRSHRSQVRRSVAMVAHDSFGYDELSVRRNLHFQARLAGVATATREAAMERLGVHEFADQPHGLLSAGQKRRSALALALMQRRPVLLLDEPHAALDADGRAFINDVLAEAVTARLTTVVVTHEPELVRHLAHREVRIRDGRCESELDAE